MSKIYQAEIAEKLILKDSDLKEIEHFNYFKIGGKLLFQDLSSLKYINSNLLMERSLPNSIDSNQYVDFFTTKEPKDVKSYLKMLISPQSSNYIETALIIKPIPMVAAESDIECIYLFKNGECAIKSISNFEYSYYNKKDTDLLLFDFGLDNTLLQRKLENDYKTKNNVENKIKFKI